MWRHEGRNTTCRSVRLSNFVAQRKETSRDNLGLARFTEYGKYIEKGGEPTQSVFRGFIRFCESQHREEEEKEVEILHVISCSNCTIKKHKKHKMKETEMGEAIPFF
jgi:hypothetical protein